MTRLEHILDLVDQQGHMDFGVMSFDLDSIWIRNMMDLMYHFSSKTSGYDFISMGTSMDGHFNGQVITNFGVVFFKNSDASKALAMETRKHLHSNFKPSYPDQDYVTRAIMVDGKATQQPLPDFIDFLDGIKQKHLNRGDKVCRAHETTCGWKDIGANGTFAFANKNYQNKDHHPPNPLVFLNSSLPTNQSSVSGSLSNSVTRGTYLYLPNVIVPRNCEDACGHEVIWGQHCGIAYCLRKSDIDVACKFDSWLSNPVRV